MDFGTSEGGDAIDFIAAACAVDKPEATRRFVEMANGAACLPSFIPFSKSPTLPVSSSSKLRLPPLRKGSLAEIEAVARSRGVSPAAVSLAQSLGTLAFAEVCGFSCWVLLDSAKRIAEARRIDRKPFPAVGELGERKAHTLRGSAKNWPAGVAVLKTLPHFRALMLVEGGPDYLAALHFCLERDVHDVLPIAMLGRSAGARLDAEALHLLRGRRLRIYPHHDPDGGGLASAEGWAEQLCAVGCEVDLYPFAGLHTTSGDAVNDLNDCVAIATSDEPKIAPLLP